MQKSLLARMFLTAAFLALVPPLLSFLLFLRTVPVKMENQVEANVEFYIDRIAGSVADSVRLAQDITFGALTDAALRDAMQQPDLVPAGRPALEKVVGSVATLQSFWSRSALNAIYIFRQDGQYISYSPKGSFVQEQRRLRRAYEALGDQSSMRTLYCLDPQLEDGRLYYLMDFKKLDNMELLGKLIIELDGESLLKFSELSQVYPGSRLVLTGDGSQAVYSRGEEVDADPEPFRAGLRGRRDPYVHVGRPVEDTRLRLDVYIPTEAMFSSVWQTSNFYLTYSLLILLAGVLVALGAYLAILTPLRKMESVLKRIAASDYEARMTVSHYRELASLERAFNQMADNLHASFEDAYQKGVRLQESESRLLAAQINPHFVFNVLETINMRCVDAGLKDISRLVTDLAQLLRGNIGVGSGSQKITFAQELNYVHYYLDLQQGRFGQGLRWSVEYEDEDILKYYLPRLTVQPLVENAVVHGLEPRRGLGSVTVRLWEEESSVYVRVEDDGVGFDSTRLNLEPPEAEEGRHNHIALPNILRRLRLLYGGRASLELHSAPGRGTAVLLVLPMDRQGNGTSLEA